MKKTWLVVLVVLSVAVAALFVIKKPGEKQATSGKIVVVVNNGPKETDTVKLRDFKKRSPASMRYIQILRFVGQTAITAQTALPPAWQGERQKT